MKTIAKYIHGSEDSLDIDVYYVTEEIPSFQEAKNFCDSFTEENVNLISIQNGQVIYCYKGTCDEIQNSLLRTYTLHEQESELLLQNSIPRDIVVKTIRVVRCFLSHYSRTKYRKEVKLALNTPDWNLKIQTLKKIDFKSLDSFKEKKVDVIKVWAFQLAQILGLLDGIEIYTKIEASDKYPELRKYLYREESNLEDLLAYLDRFLTYSESLKNIEHDIDLKTEKRINI